jgi:hypothetical protein
VAFICRENTLRQNSDGPLVLILGPYMERIYFKNMKGFLTGEFSGYPAAKNLIPILAFNARHNQRDVPLQKKCEKLFNLEWSVNK